MMSSQDYLELRTVHLKSPEEWRAEGGNLSFVFQMSGTGRYISGPNTRKLVPGDVMVFNNSFKGVLGSADGEDIEFKSFSVCFEHLFPMFFIKEISAIEQIADGFKATKLYSATIQIAKRANALLSEVNPECNLEHRAQLLRIVAVIMQGEFNSFQSQRAGLTPVEPHMIVVFERLSVTELLDLSVDDLAAKFSCSRRHISRLFHMHFGLSIAALRMELRLLKALSLLRDPNAKIINVAEQSGFVHLGLFNTLFKRRFDVTPGQWRKNAEEKELAHEPPAPAGATCGLRVTGLCPWTGQPSKVTRSATSKAGAGSCPSITQLSKNIAISHKDGPSAPSSDS